MVWHSKMMCLKCQLELDVYGMLVLVICDSLDSNILAMSLTVVSTLSLTRNLRRTWLFHTEQTILTYKIYCCVTELNKERRNIVVATLHCTNQFLQARDLYKRLCFFQVHGVAAADSNDTYDTYVRLTR